MKKLVLIYVLIALVIYAAVAVLSYGYGGGYVYLYWRDWQFQSGIWGWIALLLIISFIAQVIWWWGKRYLSREHRKKQTSLSFADLHPYEQLGVVWLLDAAQDQQIFIERVFNQSGLLNNIVDAQFDYRNGDYETALQHLEQSAPMAFELAELQRIDIFLTQQEAEKAFTHLEFLTQQPNNDLAMPLNHRPMLDRIESTVVATINHEILDRADLNAWNAETTMVFVWPICPIIL